MTPFCDCIVDGFCQRYQREMGGRLREICAGVNCDLGTSAAFREQWARESERPVVDRKCCTRLLLITDQAPGDTVAMTAAVYSLHRAHPGKYLTAIQSPHSEVWENNPDVVPADSIPGALPLHMHYPAIHQSNQRAIHFMQGWCEFLGSALGVNVPLLTNRPHLYFAHPAPPVEDYWVVCNSGKNDLTNKLWGLDNYQEVVSSLKGVIRFIQTGNSDMGLHPPMWDIDADDDMVDETTLRQLFDIVRASRGVLCGVSLLMHVAAALEKPAIVIAGGREPVAWNAYPKQHYLHTVGMLPCSSPQGDVGGACWRSRTVPIGDGTILDEHTCLRPVGEVPECMTMISPSRVVELILGYNR